MASAWEVMTDPTDELQVRSFEEEFAEFVGCRGAVAVNSGTNALIVVLRALDIYNELIQIPSFSCRALLDAVEATHNMPRLMDNVCGVRRAVFDVKDWLRLGGIGEPYRIHTHMFGTAQSLDIRKKTITDITLSLGAARALPLAVCSFHRDKMISTGRGGMIVAQDEDFLARCRMLAHYDTPAMNGFHYMPAFSFGMTGMQAALGRSQLRQLPGFIERRKEIAARYTTVFQRVGIETPAPDVGSVFFRYIIGVVDPAERVKELAALGVECGRGVDPPLHRLLGLDPSGFPGAEECWSKLLSVPVHPGLTDEQVEYITRQVVEVCAP